MLTAGVGCEVDEPNAAPISSTKIETNRPPAKPSSTAASAIQRGGVGRASCEAVGLIVGEVTR